MPQTTNIDDTQTRRIINAAKATMLDLQDKLVNSGTFFSERDSRMLDRLEIAFGLKDKPSNWKDYSDE